MTLRETIELMTDIVCKSDAELTNAKSLFITRLAACQADMKETVAAYRGAKRSTMSGVQSFNSEYINLFLTKFDLVDKMVDKLVSTATPASENPVTEEEFRAIKLDDIGIDYIPQGPMYKKLWTKEDGFLGGGDYLFRALYGTSLGLKLDNWPSTLQPVITKPFRECQLYGTEETHDGQWIGVYHSQSTPNKWTINLYYNFPGTVINKGYWGEVGSIYFSGSNTPDYIVTDTDPSSPNPQAQCAFFNRTITNIVIDRNLTLSGSNLPPLMAPEPSANFHFLDFGIKYWNESQAIFDFTKFLNGNFGSTPTTNSMNGLMGYISLAHNDKLSAEASMLDSWMDRESKELENVPVMTAIGHPRRLEMLASLYAVKFAIFKIMYGHARRIK